MWKTEPTNPRFIFIEPGLLINITKLTDVCCRDCEIEFVYGPQHRVTTFNSKEATMETFDQIRKQLVP